MEIQTPKETNHKITEVKIKRHTFSPDSDIDVEKSCFLMKSSKPLSTILNFSQFHEHVCVCLFPFTVNASLD